jgi:hypothetical protein
MDISVMSPPFSFDKRVLISELFYPKKTVGQKGIRELSFGFKLTCN